MCISVQCTHSACQKQWQQALQAEQIIDAGPKRVSPLSAFQITETKEGDMMVITTTQITQMHDIVKTWEDGPESVKEILWSEGPWLGEELEKVWENYYEGQGHLPSVTCGNNQCRSRDLCVLTSVTLHSTIFFPLFTPLSPLLLQVPRCQAWIHHVHHCTRCKVTSPQVEAMQALKDTGQCVSNNC